MLSLLQTSGEELQLELLRRAKPTSTSHIPDLPHGEGFIVEVVKHCGTLGLRIAGGADKPTGAGFIRIKQLGAKSPAAECGRLREGDILLQVREVCLHVNVAEQLFHVLCLCVGECRESCRSDAPAGGRDPAAVGGESVSSRVPPLH